MREDVANQSKQRKMVWARDGYREYQSEAHRMDVEVLESKITAQNPLFTLLEAHVIPPWSRVRCRYCRGEILIKNRRLILGQLPRDHKKCAEAVFRVKEGSRVYGTSGNGGIKQLKLKLPEVPFTYKIISRSMHFYDTEGRALGSVKLPLEYSSARIEGERILSGS